MALLFLAMVAGILPLMQPAHGRHIDSVKGKIEVEQYS